MGKGVGYTWSVHQRLENPVLDGLKCSSLCASQSVLVLMGSGQALLGASRGLLTVVVPKKANRDAHVMCHAGV